MATKTKPIKDIAFPWEGASFPARIKIRGTLRQPQWCARALSGERDPGDEWARGWEEAVFTLAAEGARLHAGVNAPLTPLAWPVVTHDSAAPLPGEGRGLGHLCALLWAAGDGPALQARRVLAQAARGKLERGYMVTAPPEVTSLILAGLLCAGREKGDGAQADEHAASPEPVHTEPVHAHRAHADPALMDRLLRCRPEVTAALPAAVVAALTEDHLAPGQPGEALARAAVQAALQRRENEGPWAQRYASARGEDPDGLKRFLSAWPGGRSFAERVFAPQDAGQEGDR